MTGWKGVPCKISTVSVTIVTHKWRTQTHSQCLALGSKKSPCWAIIIHKDDLKRNSRNICQGLQGCNGLGARGINMNRTQFLSFKSSESREGEVCIEHGGNIGKK